MFLNLGNRGSASCNVVYDSQKSCCGRTYNKICTFLFIQRTQGRKYQTCIKRSIKTSLRLLFHLMPFLVLDHNIYSIFNAFPSIAIMFISCNVFPFIVPISLRAFLHWFSYNFFTNFYPFFCIVQSFLIASSLQSTFFFLSMTIVQYCK